jgi:selenocysteine lyase/cysteine desulfurase
MNTSVCLESWFSPFRKNIIGIDQQIRTQHGLKRMLYADWTASGRAYATIEKYLYDNILPFWANTHSEGTATAIAMTTEYENAKRIIKQNVNASDNDVLLMCGSGMTSAVNKLQRMIGLRYNDNAITSDNDRPIVFVTELEHHSNHISWLETTATVEIIKSGDDGNVDLDHLESLLIKFKNRKIKIAAITACSNVTGIETPYHEIAEIMHRSDGFCFVDFASSAPYVEIDMHPGAPGTHLDAIYFSCHKFLGGPGTPGVLVFNKNLYEHKAPDHPGGGTVIYTNPWHDREYIYDIETREDGGTPPLLQTIKAGLCFELKSDMTTAKIRERERELADRCFQGLADIEGLTILEPRARKRLGIISFIVDGLHHDDVVKALNDRYGIQSRGGCSCAGPYGHRLLNVGRERSLQILDSLRSGNTRAKPGWVRISLHPTMTNDEVDLIVDSVKEISKSLQSTTTLMPSL